MPNFASVTSDQAGGEREVYRLMAAQEKSRSELTSWMVHDPSEQILITGYCDDVRLLEQLETTAKTIVASREPPTKVASNRLQREIIQTTQTGKALVALCDVFDPTLPSRHRHHLFNPWIKMMTVALRHWHSGDGFGHAIYGVGILPEDRRHLDRMVRFVRRVGQSQAFQRKQESEKAASLKRYRSAVACLLSLFSRHAQLLIVRLNLYCQGEAGASARTGEAQAAFERFMRMLRTGRIVPDVLTCLVSPEVAPPHSAHHHVLVVLNGHAATDADALVKVIGQRWARHYTGDLRGAFFNSYAAHDQDTYNGLGRVHVADWRKLIGLRLAIGHLVKPDYLVKVKLDAKKSYRRGRIEPIAVESGDPQGRWHDLREVSRILGDEVFGDRSKQ